jgi:hypothetical protein
MASKIRKANCIFVNELMNPIEMTVTKSEIMVRIVAVSPESTIDHTWTVIEAHNLMDMLREVLDAPGSEQTQGHNSA